MCVKSFFNNMHVQLSIEDICLVVGFMRGPRKILSEGTHLKSDVFCFVSLLALVDEERGSKIPLKANHHRSANKTPFK